MQPVKVVPDGPPVPAVLVSKGGHSVIQNDYTAHSSYGAPKPVYQAPKPTYDKPKYDGYGAPKANDAAPTSYSPPKPTYNAPSPTYGAPKPSYQPPPSSSLDSYSAPKPTYNPPKPTYNAPSSSYGAPKPTYNAPSPSYGGPKPTYNAPSYSSLSKSDSSDRLGIKRESVDHHGHAPVGHDHSHNHNHHHGSNLGHDQGHRQGRLEECICMPAAQCPSHSVMPFGGGHNLQQNAFGGGHGGLQQNAPLRQDVTPLQDYSGLIDPRIKINSDIVAAGEHGEDDTIDLEEAIDDKVDSNRAR